MRVFWALIVVLVLATGGLLAMRGRTPDGSATLTNRSEPSGAVQADTAEPVTEAGAADGEAIAVDEPVVAEPAPEEPAVDDEADAPLVEAEPADEPEEMVTVDIGRADEDEPAPVLDDTPVPLDDDTAVADAGGAEAESDDAPVLPEGATLLNDTHVVTGSGTAEDPYVIDFDLLVAVERDYEPRTEGKTEVPEWIKTLDGKHVEITGFLGFPYIAATSDECLVMLNQWDGCCIGVPPTPYDAIEVQLAKEIDTYAGAPNYGTITGVFRTDPYLLNGWLIGLYVMEDALLTDAGSRNQLGF